MPCVLAPDLFEQARHRTKHVLRPPRSLGHNWVNSLAFVAAGHPLRAKLRLPPDGRLASSSRSVGLQLAARPPRRRLRLARTESCLVQRPGGSARSSPTAARKRSRRRQVSAWSRSSRAAEPASELEAEESFHRTRALRSRHRDRRLPVQQRNAQRALEKSKAAAGLDILEGQLSWHSPRQSAGSIWLTEYALPVTTVSAMMGHANPAFTLACYGARSPRGAEDGRGCIGPRGSGWILTFS